MIVDKNIFSVDERVSLSKYNGEPLPENEFERIVVHNGLVIEHSIIENGEVAGPVAESNLLGKEIGRLISKEEN